MKSSNVIPLHSRTALKEMHSGGKAARLAGLLRRDLPVPSGYVLTTAFYRRLQSSPKRPLSAATGEELAARLDPGVKRKILGAIRRLDGPVSVRSSMIGEDSPGRSFAGQLRTVLNVTGGEGLFEAIRRCYASLEGSRFIHYADAAGKGKKERPGDLALLIQRMVPARSAGVAFSADPVTGARRIIIEAVPGTGEKLVSGRAVPDRFIVEPQGSAVRRETAEGAKPVLDEEQVARLCELIQRIHRCLGSPQDIEWAWDGSRFWVLQSRSISTLHGRHLYSNRLVSEMMPGLIKPLLWSTSVADMMSNVFVRIFRNLSGDGRINASALVRRFHSRIYADMSRFGELLEQLGLPANFFEMVTHDELSQRGHFRINGHLLRSVPRMALFVARYSRIRQRAGRFIRLHDLRLDLYRRQDWSTSEPVELLERSQILRKYHGQTQWYMWITAINMTARRKLLSRFLGRHIPEVSAAELLSGLVKLKSLEPNRRLMNMASQTRRLAPEDLQALLQDDDRAIRARLSRTTPGRALAAEFDDLMERYGFLSSSGTDFTVPPWSEQPQLIWRAIGQLTAAETGNGRTRASGARVRAERQVHDRLNWLQRRRFRYLLRSTRRHVRLRERISLFMSEDIAHMRGLYLALGRRLAGDGRLSVPDDLFYLYFRELARLVDGSADEDLLRQEILERRKTLEADAAVDAEDLFYGPPCLWRPTGGVIPAPYLEGIAGSHGRVQGFARIIRDPREVAAPLGKRDILVVPHTDVGWTPLFPGIGGLVAETGGQLSHSSIVAREYGLPAVVSVRNATRIIRGGQPITVDGDRGRVYLKHVPSGVEAAR